MQAASAESAPLTQQTCKARLAGQSQEFLLNIKASSGRLVPVIVFAPLKSGSYPLAAFSHGAFAAPDRYRAMLAPIAAAGFIVVAPMHVDSEDFDSDTPPAQSEVWLTRNDDMALALAPPSAITNELSDRGLSLDDGRTVAIGHSYGALIAQLTGGAKAIEHAAPLTDRSNPDVDAVVGWSPPGPRAGVIAKEGWSSLAVPALTITGTKDVFPGFVDDWRVHTTSYESGPSGLSSLWVGKGVDHYFGGVFGREKPADTVSQRLFEQALAKSLEFLEQGVNVADPCILSDPIEGEARSKK
ncbi:MAG: alpha/beta hydrolase family protein [Erythrobacter sp.]